MTPAILFVRKAKIAHDVLSYEHDPAAESYGREAVDLLQLEPATVFKTLVADAEGVGLVCAVVPVLMMLDLKALAAAVGARRVRMADPAAAERATGYVLGIDASALAFERVYVSAGRRGLELSLAPMDLVKLSRGRTGPIARA